MGRRLADMNARKREERLQEDETKLAKLLSIKQLQTNGRMDEFKRQLRENSISNKTELDVRMEFELQKKKYRCYSMNNSIFQNQIQSARGRIDRTKQKIDQFESGNSNVFLLEDKSVPQPPQNKPISEWVSEVKRKRTAILERRSSRKQRKQDLAKRRTVAAQERMRIISQLARKEKGEDNFGMRDEDWDVYKAISKDGDSDSDTENEKLLAFEEILRHHDPTFEEPQIIQEGAAESYQVNEKSIVLLTQHLLYSHIYSIKK